MTTKDKIITLLKQTESLKLQFQEKNIILLANTREHTKQIGSLQIQFSEKTEFFKEEEFEQISDGLKEEGYYVQNYFNEIQFIKDILQEKLNTSDIFLYNLARNGIKQGKKSLIPSFCDLLQIRYTGSNAFAISLCRNKYIFSKVLKAHQIPVPNCWLYLGNGAWGDNMPSFGTKIIIKPLFESASIGLSNENVLFFSKSSENILQNVYIKNWNNPLLVQEFIAGYECETPLFRSNVPVILEPIGIALNNNKNLENQILTQEISDSDTYSFYSMSEILPQNKLEELLHYCERITNILGIENYGRIDFRIDNKYNLYITDIAASPFTTKHSSMAHIFEQNGFPYSKIFTIILGCKWHNYVPVIEN